MKIIVLDRVEERHPDISKKDAAEAWLSVVDWALDVERNDPRRYIGIGFDSKGRQIEIVAIRKNLDTWVIIHDQTPAKTDIKRKLGLIGGKNDKKRQ